jgi:uroporphyrinogen decarboxylase
MMTSRERVRRAFDHQDPDRVPVDFGGTVVTCLDREAHLRLKKHMGIVDDPDPIIDYTMGTVEPCEPLRLAFRSDFRRIGMNVTPPVVENGSYVNGFGNTLKRADPHLYFDTVSNPLRDASIGDLETMKLPDPDDEALWVGLRDRARDLYENSSYAIVADFGVPGFYETSQKLRGYENFACDLMIDRDFVSALFDRLLELQKRFFSNYLDRVGGYAQVIGYADDLGMQDRLQMSPEVYREVIKPYHKKIFSFIHGKADIKILLHSCGAIFPIIEDLIDAGVDILNPVQTRALGMDPAALKESFGDRIVFWGGLDVQHTLPYGTVEEIGEEAERLMRIMGRDGGYVFAPSHNIQDDTPPENVEAMFRAAERMSDLASRGEKQHG